MSKRHTYAAKTFQPARISPEQLDRYLFRLAELKVERMNIHFPLENCFTDEVTIMIDGNIESMHDDSQILRIAADLACHLISFPEWQQSQMDMLEAEKQNADSHQSVFYKKYLHMVITTTCWSLAQQSSISIDLNEYLNKDSGVFNYFQPIDEERERAA